MKKVNIAVVGLGFGRSFASIYQRHPNVGRVTICDLNQWRLDWHREHDKIEHALGSLDEVLADSSIDAVHLCTGIPDHARQSIAVLNAGKHCACAVPMATSLEDIHAILAASKASGKLYTMMETQLFANDYLYVKGMIDRGEMGRLQFLRGSHFQDMENWPSYWAGLPPMWYATHAIAPLMGAAGTRARHVNCLGSGYLRDELQKPYGNPFSMETAIFRMDRDVPLAMEVTRALFHTARWGTESFCVYGEDASYEAPQHAEYPVVFRQNKLEDIAGAGPYKSRVATADRVHPPYYIELLPQEIASYGTGGHGGSHPHLANDFVQSILGERKPECNQVMAADITAAGICAHESAMKDGATVEIPRFG